MAFFAALIPTLLKAIMGSGAVAIPAMTGATGAAGAAGGTVGGAIPDSVVTAEGAPMETGATAGGGVAAGGLGGGAGGSPTAPQSPQQIGPGGKYGGTEGAGGMRPTMRASEISGVPDDWLPYKVPNSGFGRFLQRWGGEDPAAGNARFIANKQQFGMQKAMQMEQDARASADKFKLQDKDQQFQSGENQKRTQAERDLERERRGFQIRRENDQNEWTAKNQDRIANLNRMEENFSRFGYTYDPIEQQDYIAKQREYEAKVRDSQLKRLQAPIGLSGGGFFDPETDTLGMPDRGEEPKLIGYKPGTTEPITTPGRSPGFVLTPRGGAPVPVPVPAPTPIIPPQGSGGMPAVDPSRLQYLPPTGGAAPQAAAQESFFDSILKRISGGRPNMYSTPR